MCGKSLYCGCFGMPQTESTDCCGCPPIRPPHVTQLPQGEQRGKNCPCKQTRRKQNCEQIICFIPTDVNANAAHCQHAHQRQICCRIKQQILQQHQHQQQHPQRLQQQPPMQCGAAQNPGCIPMTCEPMPNCPNRFICRPQVQGHVRCPRSNIQCKQTQPQQKSQKPVFAPKTADKPMKNPPKPITSSNKQCIMTEICPHNPKCSSSANKCDPNSSFEEFKKKK